ncbi:MAG: serine hydrolase domain-containing protein [Actinomycetota bacterium]
MTALAAIESWPVPTVAAGWRRADDGPTSTGPTGHRFALASVTKPLVAYAVLVAVEEGSLAFDQPVTEPGATVAHLLSHSSGLAPEADQESTSSRPGTRRIYSNQGFELLGQLLTESTGIDIATYLTEAVLDPLGMTATALDGSPAHGAVSTVDDLLRFGGELLRPTLLAPETVARATSPHLPGLDGVLPGYGRQVPNPWGLGFEIRASKSPHWTGSRNSPRTYGHFGRAGTFFWVDPALDGFCVALTDREFGPWAIEAWPPFADGVVAEMAASTPGPATPGTATGPDSVGG